MSCDLPCMSHMALYLISVHIVNSNSNSKSSSSHWKLNLQDGKVVHGQADNSLNNDAYGDDRVMDILMNKIIDDTGDWKVECSKKAYSNSLTKSSHDQDPELSNGKLELVANDSDTGPLQKNSLTCGKVAKTTKYDDLRGISSRDQHPHIPEPEVAMIFRTDTGTGRDVDVDMSRLEDKLRKLKKRKPDSSQVYNQIGNFWRIKGNTQLSIECFRKALAISPDNPEILLNLARVLFNLQYLDDAILLTRRSLELQAPGQNPWLQHFTLAEILKSYGHFHEASIHFRHTLDLHPGFAPAYAHIRDLEGTGHSSITHYTLVIILLLVLGVLCGVLTSIESSFDESMEPTRTQRHFNRAMAMRSIKLGINPRLMRLRKCNY